MGTARALLLLVIFTTLAFPSDAQAGNDDKTVDDQHSIIGVSHNTKPPEFVRTTNPNAQWYPKASLGLFIHWGLASVTGKSELSWAMMKNLPWDPDGKYVITPNEYFSLARKFNPNNYDPNKWLKAAKAAGFTYAQRARHHTGTPEA